MSTDTDKNSSQFGERLRKERKKLGLSQIKVADLCGVSREMWGKYERGVSIPGCDVLFPFAALGADLNFLATGKHSYSTNEENPGYILRPDQIALLDNLEHCAPQDQDAIRRMALIAAKAEETEETQPKKKNHNH